MKAIYRRDGWVLCRCTACGRLNYVEPHGTTARCKCSDEWTEHTNLPPDECDAGMFHYIGKRSKP